MSLHKRDAPITLLSLIWSIAGILGIFLAVLISSFFLLKYFFPVSADEAIPPNSGNNECTNVAINNYPGQEAIGQYYSGTDYQHGAVEKAIGGTYRCSQICIPGLNKSIPVSSTENKKIIEDFLKTAKIGGQPVEIVSDGKTFVETIKNDSNITTDDTARLNRTVILSSSKTICAGYNQPGGQGTSKYYDEITVGDETVPAKNDSVDNPKPSGKAELKNQGQADPEPLAGPPQTEFKAPVSDAGQKCIKTSDGKYRIFRKTATGSWRSEDGYIVNNAAVIRNESENPEKDCGLKNNTKEIRQSLNDCLYDAGRIKERLRQAYEKDPSANPESQIIPVMKTYYGLLNRRKSTDDPEGDLVKCQKLLTDLRSLDNATDVNLTTKEKLDECKTSINTFLGQHLNSSDPEIKKISLAYIDLKFPRNIVRSAKTQLILCQAIYNQVVEYQQNSSDSNASANSTQLGFPQQSNVPQPKFVDYYVTSWASVGPAGIRGNLDNGGWASMVIDQRGKVFWLYSYKQISDDQRTSTTRQLIQPVKVNEDGSWSNSGTWIENNTLGNVDTAWSNGSTSKVHQNIINRVRKAGLIGIIPEF